MSRGTSALSKCEVKTPITLPSRCSAMGRVEQELVGSPAKALARVPREGSGSLSMQPVDCTPWCYTDTPLSVQDCLVG